MANGYETSWADQWDPEPAYGSYDNKNSTKKKSTNSNEGGARKKVEDGLAKTKEVASTGFKKVKQGTSSGFNWLKDKYSKTTQKNKL